MTYSTTSRVIGACASAHRRGDLCVRRANIQNGLNDSRMNEKEIAMLSGMSKAKVASTSIQYQKRPSLTSLSGRVLGVALAALLVLPAVQATPPAEAGKKFKTVTETISSNGQIDIPDVGTQGPANPYPTTIDVDDFAEFKKAKIKDVNLTLRGLSHANTENIDVMLTLGNKRALVMGDPGTGVDVDNLTITLDDDADQALEEGATLASGTFRPANLTGVDPFPAPAPAPNANVALSTFNGQNPDGEWQLFVHDDTNGNTGTISAGWELEITAKVKNEDSEKDKKSKKGKKGKKGKKED
jgi:hypothetical protein